MRAHRSGPDGVLTDAQISVLITIREHSRVAREGRISDMIWTHLYDNDPIPIYGLALQPFRNGCALRSRAP